MTDGIHWGTRDYRYLRNAMLTATGVGLALLWALPLVGEESLTGVWGVTGVWISLRAGFGVARVWPGIGTAPLAAQPPRP